MGTRGWRRPGRAAEPRLGACVRGPRVGGRGHGRARRVPALRRRQSAAPRGGDDRARDGPGPRGAGGARDLERTGGAAARDDPRGDAVAPAGGGGATLLRRDRFAARGTARQSRRAGLDGRHPARRQRRSRRAGRRRPRPGRRGGGRRGDHQPAHRARRCPGDQRQPPIEAGSRRSSWIRPSPRHCSSSRSLTARTWSSTASPSTSPGTATSCGGVLLVDTGTRGQRLARRQCPAARDAISRRSTRGLHCEGCAPRDCASNAAPRTPRRSPPSSRRGRRSPRCTTPGVTGRTDAALASRLLPRGLRPDAEHRSARRRTAAGCVHPRPRRGPAGAEPRRCGDHRELPGEHLTSGAQPAAASRARHQRRPRADQRRHRAHR